MTTTWSKRGLVASRATRLAGSFRKAQLVILTYHSALDQSKPDFVALDRILRSTEVFEKHIDLISRDYVPVTMDDVLLCAQGQSELPARAVAVTFDDGYLDSDSCEVSVPVIDRSGGPATFYMTVDCVETGKMPWPSRLRHAFSSTRRRNWNDQHGGTWLLGWNDRHGGTWPLESQQQRQEAYLKAYELCAALPGSVQEQFTRAIEAALDVDRSRYGQGLTMNADHAGSLVAKGYIVGSPMVGSDIAHVSDDQEDTELLQPKRRMERALEIPIVHFSYPYPPFSPEREAISVELSREVAYQRLVSTAG
jgi:peptidoglycan/xylan/chitin deacetylase (PgdA/CDA1 family)